MLFRLVAGIRNVYKFEFRKFKVHKNVVTENKSPFDHIFVILLVKTFNLFQTLPAIQTA